MLCTPNPGTPRHMAALAAREHQGRTQGQQDSRSRFHCCCCCCCWRMWHSRVQETHPPSTLGSAHGWRGRCRSPAPRAWPPSTAQSSPGGAAARHCHRGTGHPGGRACSPCPRPTRTRRPRWWWWWWWLWRGRQGLECRTCPLRLCYRYYYRHCQCPPRAANPLRYTASVAGKQGQCTVKPG